MRSTSILLAGLSLALGLALSPGTLPAAGAAPAQLTAGQAEGGLWLPSLSSIGKVFGRMTGPAGQVYTCSGFLEPDLYGGSLWTGFSPTGDIDGTLAPATAGGPTLHFSGTYATTSDGRGRFHAWVTEPAAVAGQPSTLVGSFDGEFRDAAQIDPQTLLPLPGDFQGQWAGWL